VSFDWLNVGHSNNVVLYREHLRDDDDSDGDTTDDGISLSQYDNESVPEMAGIHEASEVPSATSAELDNTQYHSNVHLGELTLGRDPTALGGEETYSLGVLYNDSLGGAFDSQSDIREVVDMATRNYALYGINVEYVSPENWSVDPRLVDSIDGVDLPIGTSVGDELEAIVGSELVEQRFDEQPDLLVYFSSDTQSSTPCFGRAAADRVDRENPVPILICTANQGDDQNDIPRNVSSRLTNEGELRLLTTKTLVHELGHALDLGELDDRDGEVYSGDEDENRTDDYTPESTIVGGDVTQEWSVMAFAKDPSMFAGPMNGTYFGFSIEELLSAREKEDDD